MWKTERKFTRLEATEEERAEMYRNGWMIGRSHYEEFEELAKNARSQEEYEYYREKAHWAFKIAEALICDRDE